MGGIDIKHEPKFASVLQLVSGKLDDLAEPGAALIFDNQAEKLGVKVGDALTYSAPTTRGTNNTIDVRVVAIAKGMGLPAVSCGSAEEFEKAFAGAMGQRGPMFIEAVI